MKGKYGLVLLVALMAVLFTANMLAQTYTQLTGQKIPGALEINSSNSSYGVAFFGKPFSIDKEEVLGLFRQIKGNMLPGKEQIKEMGQQIVITWEDWMTRVADLVRELTGNGAKQDGIKDKGDLI